MRTAASPLQMKRTRAKCYFFENELPIWLKKIMYLSFPRPRKKRSKSYFYYKWHFQSWTSFITDNYTTNTTATLVGIITFCHERYLIGGTIPKNLKPSCLSCLFRETLPLTLADLDAYDVPHLEAVTFTPTGSGVAFIYNNDIYYKPNVRKPHEFRLTSDGQEGVIFNGRPDYLYETRVFESGQAMWFSQDAAMLLFASFNCSLVGEQAYPHYGNNVSKYGKQWKYPTIVSSLGKTWSGPQNRLQDPMGLSLGMAYFRLVVW